MTLNLFKSSFTVGRKQNRAFRINIKINFKKVKFSEK